jgi:VCBS repeat-containing protein
VTTANDGSATFSISSSVSGTATITATLGALSDTANKIWDTNLYPPVAQDDTYTTDEDTVLSVSAPGILGNDYVVYGNVLSVSSVDTSGTTGLMTWSADGSFSYDPNGKFEHLAIDDTDTDTFSYTVSDGNGGTDTATVTITVIGINDPPVAANDNYSTDEDTILSVSASGLLGNDSDVDGDSLFIESYTQPTDGSVSANADGSFTYDPNPHFNGIDSFDYTVSDGRGGTDTATVTLTVTVTVTLTVDSVAQNLELTPEEALNILPDDEDHQFTVTVRNQLGLRMAGEIVTLSTDFGTLNTNQVITGSNGTATFTISSSVEGTATITATLANLSDTATITWAPSELAYFTVDLLGKITKEQISSDGRLIRSLEAGSPDGTHLLQMEMGMRALDDEGNIVTLVEIRLAEIPELPSDTVLVGHAYDFGPSGTVFDKPIRITLGYDVAQLPEHVASVALAYYTTEAGWTNLKSESGSLAELGRLTAPTDHFTIFAVLATVISQPASFLQTWWWLVLILVLTMAFIIWRLVRKYVF